MPTVNGESIANGDSVKDEVSGLSGIVECISQYRFGCVRVTFQPEGATKDGKPFEMVTQDEPAVVLLKAGAAPSAVSLGILGTHGERDTPAERAVPPAR